ncbi:hypothetical protein QBC47DRAFT_432266 [Echria macrotheca]|uniref:Heterokaryon incompatibility domain-containing protein n=1 Tax=Echria macrotheca TaxID=438768 RepID=A0AAJ0F3U3_9PEZI|nr:hypothetical protein QBC47DRAFT_432266 [Echria macrotheca]
MVEINDRLCHACGSIFNGSAGPHRTVVQTDFPASHTHHLNLQSFRTAVEAGCFICSIFSIESRGSPSNDIDSEEQEPLSNYMFWERSQIPGTCMLNVQINDKHAAYSNIKPSHYLFEVVKIDQDIISLNVPSTQRLDLLSRWISDCCQSNNAPHTACQHYRETVKKLELRKPSRLLELGSGNSQGSVRLTSLGPETAPFPPYVTLSRQTKTLAGTSSLLAISDNNWLPLNELPRIIQDALTITQHAGARFLWTPDLWDDDDTLIRDKRHHHHKSDIIAGGLFNIAPASAHHFSKDDDDDEGLLPTADLNSSGVPVVAPTWAPSSSKYAVLDPDALRKSLAPSTSDAQAYHDNFIAPATLYCTTQQLWWQCFEGPLYSETFPSGAGNGSKLPLIRGIHNLEPRAFHNLDDSHPMPIALPAGAWPFPERLTSLWTQVVSVFSAAAGGGQQQAPETKEEGTRLLLADSMASHLRDLASPYQPGFEKAVYRTGLWFAAPHSVHQLLWHVVPTKQTPMGDKETPAPGRRVSGVPTWSWLATTAPADYVFYVPVPIIGCALTTIICPGTILDDAVAEVVDVSSLTRPAAETESRAVDGATLSLRGRLVPVEIRQDDSRGSEDGFCAVFLDAGRATAGIVFDAAEEKALAREHGDGASEYFALPLTFMALDTPGTSRRFAMQGLVLRPCPAGDGNDGGGGVYSRCGWFQQHSGRDFRGEWKDVDVLETLGLGRESDRQTIVLV